MLIYIKITRYPDAEHYNFQFTIDNIHVVVYNFTILLSEVMMHLKDVTSFATLRTYRFDNKGLVFPFSGQYILLK